MNADAIIDRLEASSLVTEVTEVPGGLEVITTLAATDATGSTDRIHALITTAVRNGGGLSRQVSPSETRFTADGAGVWRIAA